MKFTIMAIATFLLAVQAVPAPVSEARDLRSIEAYHAETLALLKARGIEFAEGMDAVVVPRRCIPGSCLCGGPLNCQGSP